MARVFIDSFETQDLGLWDINYGCSTTSTAGLNMKGNYCLRATSSTYSIYKFLPENNEYYFAFEFRISYIASGYVIRIYHDGTYFFSILNGGNLYYNVVAGGGGYGSKSVVANTTYFMQLYVKIANSGGRFFSKINGAIDFDSTTDTQPGADTTINKVVFGHRNYYDNIVIDDSEMPEETEIIILKPNGVGTFSDWNPTSGDNYSCVDEVPYNDSDYVASGIVNAVDTYTLEDMPSNAKDVKCVQAQSRARKDSDSTATRFNFVMREGTTNYDSDAFLLSNTFDDYYTMYSDGPTGSGFWYIPDMNNMEVGVKVRT